MAAAILSIAAREQNESWISQALLWLSLIAFVLLLVRNLGAVLDGVDLGSAWPVLVLFTWVASCGVLGQRLSDTSSPVRSALALLAATGMVCALILLARALPSTGSPARWKVSGSWLLAVVALQSLSIDCNAIASRTLESAAIALWVLGMAVYGLVVVLLLRNPAPQFQPDHWIGMGALAISTVAAAPIPHAAGLAIAVWLAAGAWMPYLVAMEVVHVRRAGLETRYQPLRWSTVFPLGMFSVAIHQLGIPILEPVAAAFLWLGLTIACLNLVAAAKSFSHEAC